MENKLVEKYQLNIAEIDHRYKMFFELCKGKYKQVDSSNYKKLVVIVNELEDYLKNQFPLEEDLLLKTGSDDSENHIAQHQFFIQKMEELKLDLNYKNPLLFEKIIAFMKKWFLSHIMNSDKKLQKIALEYLKNNPE